MKLIPLFFLLAAEVTWGQVERTFHNFTVTGPGIYKGAPSGQLCAICHEAHGPEIGTLEGGQFPGISYILYSSPTVKAVPDQPKGSSRLCLSCHDGIFPLKKIAPSLGPLVGKGVLGVNLSDDHPISIVHDSSLALRRQSLAHPVSLPRVVKLDGASMLQCTSCHDPHSNRFGKFLVMDNSMSQLCKGCHRFPAIGIGGSTHSASQLLCNDCHQVHGAYQSRWLLKNKSWDIRIPR